MNIRDTWNQHKDVISLSIFVNVLVTLVVAAVVWQVVQANQGAIFNQLADRYIQQRTATSATSTSIVSQESQVVDVVQQANPAVVSIVITQQVPTFERRYRQFGPFRVPELRREGTQRQRVGEGSGFIVSEGGLVVTNRHVVSQEGASYTIVTSDGEKLDAEVVARDSMMDIAVMQITESGSYPHLSFGNSDNLKLGETVIAIGNALAEFRNTVSVGVVSGLSRSITAGSIGQREQLEGVIQTDAAINPGNSGGPLLDLSGNVVGVNTAIAQGSENIGFALPASAVERIVDSVRTQGKIVRPYLGVRYVSVNEAIAARNNLSVKYGALITPGSRRGDLAVLPNSPAARADLEAGDIILSIDGQSLQETDLATVIRQKEVGQTVSLTILRNGERTQKQVTLEKRPNN